MKTKPISRLPFQKVVQEVWAYILGFDADNGFAPTLLEIAHQFTNKQTGTVYSRHWAWLCVRELQRQGKVNVRPKQLRGIEIRKDQPIKSS